MPNGPSALSRALLNPPAPILFEPLLRAALLEDISHGGDLTTDAIVDADRPARAAIIARKDGVLAGIDIGTRVFALLDPHARVDVRVRDGVRINAGETAAHIECDARALLTGERTALNVICRLSGIATATRTLVDLVQPFGTKVIDTRKTTPGLRVLEKYAVRCGGGFNHRFGLDDAVLIKDNHLALAGSVRDAVDRVRAVCGHMVRIEVECDTTQQLEAALDCGVDAVLLDNMSEETLREGVRLAGGRALTEASGSITLERAISVARAGVDLISSGWLTHSAPALDLGLDVEL